MDKERSLDFMRSLLDISEFDSVASQVRTGSDAELLLDLILHVCINSVKLARPYTTLSSV